MGQLLSQAESRDRRTISDVRAKAKERQQQTADSLYGAQKYGRDVGQQLIIPLYHGKPPKEPEHGFELIWVQGKRRHLWHEAQWVELSGELMRRVESHGLRTALARACRYQEARMWATNQTTLQFRDQLIDVKFFAEHLDQRIKDAML